MDTSRRSWSTTTSGSFGTESTQTEGQLERLLMRSYGLLGSVVNSEPSEGLDDNRAMRGAELSSP